MVRVMYSMEQLWNLGLLMGHNKNNTTFLGTWLVRGFIKIGNGKRGSLESFYILKYLYTLVGFRMLHFLFRSCVYNRLSIIFVCNNIKFSGVAMLYAMISGEAYSGYNWVGGAVTNWKEVVGYLYMIVIYYKQGYKLHHKHKKRLVVLSGISYTRLSRAGMSFFFRLKEASVALQEAGSARSLMSTGISDTDVMASELNLPLVANDSSIFSLHFFGYYISINTLKLKAQQLFFWKDSLRRSSKLRLKLILINFLSLLKDQSGFLNDFVSYGNYMVGRNDFDSTFVFGGINSFNVLGRDNSFYNLNMELSYPSVEFWKKNNNGSFN